MARRLGRGLDDLLDDSDVDLPFLSAYGEASGEHIEGATPSSASDDPAELHEAMLRHLAGGTPEGLSLKVLDEGVKIKVSSQMMLPLVPSDLTMPGFRSGVLSEDRLSASVVICAWGVEVRRLLDRLVEHATS